VTNIVTDLKIVPGFKRLRNRQKSVILRTSILDLEKGFGGMLIR
jgi:hypothetical protein